MMALIHRIRARLPHGRALLYEEICEAYLQSIDEFRGVEGLQYPLAQRKRWLATVALNMQLRRAERHTDENSPEETRENIRILRSPGKFVSPVKGHVEIRGREIARKFQVQIEGFWIVSIQRFFDFIPAHVHRMGGLENSGAMNVAGQLCQEVLRVMVQYLFENFLRFLELGLLLMEEGQAQQRLDVAGLMVEGQAEIFLRLGEALLALIY